MIPAQDLHTALLLSLEAQGTYALEDYEPEEIDLVFNRAQDRLIEARRGNPLAASRDLRALIEEWGPVSLTDRSAIGWGYSNEHITGLPADFRFEVRVEATVTRSASPVTASGTPVVCRYFSGQTREVRATPHHRPYLRQPRYTFEEDRIHLFVDEETTPSAVLIAYVRNPEAIALGTTDCELPPYLKEELVEIAHQIVVRDLTLTPLTHEAIQ